MPLTLKHFQTGSEYPVPDYPGKVRFYNMQFCPYAQRTQLLLIMKNIEHETVNIHLTKKPEWYLEKINPLGKVPSVQMGDKIVFDSVIINEYLDSVYPGGKFTPTDPFQKAKDQMLLERMSNIVVPFYKLFFTAGEDKDAIGPLFSGLDEFEKELEQRATPFYGGKGPMMIDIMMWPHMIRVWYLRHFIPELAPLDETRFPRLTSWKDSMMSVPAMKQTEIDTEIYKTFVISVKNNDPAYDLGLDE